MSTQNSTPRQKMINMMYLVLTALLALNVSAEVLKAFKIVNESIAQSNNTLAKNNNLLQKQFEQRLQNDPKKVAPIHAKALQAKQISQNTYDYLESLKNEIVMKAGGYDLNTGMLKNADDINIATRYFVEQDGKNGKALKARLDKSKQEFLTIIEDEQQRKELAQILKMDEQMEDPSKPWEYNMFNHMPAVASITMLSKYQNDIKNAEAKILENLYKSIDAQDYKVDAMKACVIAPSTRLLQGDKYEASIMVAAYSSTQSPSIYIGAFTNAIRKNSDGTYDKLENLKAVPLSNSRKIEAIDGVGAVHMDASSVGSQRYTGVVEVKNPSGVGFDYYPFEGTYEVTPKVSSISPSFMNVFYVGVDNPVDIAVGATGSEIIPSMNLGKLSKVSNGKYNATFSAPGTATIAVKAKVGDKVFDMGTQQFRVKNVPTPSITLNGVYAAGPIVTKKMLTTTGVVAMMPPDFEFKVSVKVAEYSVIIQKKDGTVVQENIEGAAYSTKIKNLINRTAVGDVVHLENVIAIMPGNIRKNIGNASFYIKG